MGFPVHGMVLLVPVVLLFLDLVDYWMADLGAS